MSSNRQGNHQQKASELSVLTKAREMCGYVMQATAKSPKQFRFSFVGKMQNLAIEVIECIFKANDTFVGGPLKARLAAERLNFQRRALTNIKILAFLAMLAMEQKCLTMKQYEQISMFCGDCGSMLAGWMNSDRRRFNLENASFSS